MSLIFYAGYYAHMPIGMLGIYRLMFVCPSTNFFVMDIAGMG